LRVLVTFVNVARSPGDLTTELRQITAEEADSVRQLILWQACAFTGS
jgi:hypothetical protein